MSSSAVSFGQLLRRFRENRTAASAVEFAIVAPLFLALLFAIIETALMFFAGQVLETMTQDAARMILTGQAQAANYQQSDFKTYVCNQIPALFS
jgi:Flp pilus assembly protein TadG